MGANIAKKIIFLEILMHIHHLYSTELHLNCSNINKKTEVWKRLVTTLCLIEKRI